MRHDRAALTSAVVLATSLYLPGQEPREGNPARAPKIEWGPSIGLRVQTLTGYEIGLGTLVTRFKGEKLVSGGVQLTVNHASLGAALCLKIGEGSSSGFRALFIRPKYRYLRKDSHIERYERWRGGSYGLEVGLNVAGHGAPISAFLGALRNSKTGATEAYIGVGIDY